MLKHPCANGGSLAMPSTNSASQLGQETLKLYRFRKKLFVVRNFRTTGVANKVSVQPVSVECQAPASSAAFAAACFYSVEPFLESAIK
jgi:hypothetical protein